MIETLCWAHACHGKNPTWAFSTTEMSLLNRGLFELVPTDAPDYPKLREGATASLQAVRLSEAGEAVCELLKIAGLYPAMPKFEAPAELPPLIIRRKNPDGTLGEPINASED